MHTPRITHIALHVVNIDECIRFYEEFYGLYLVHERQSGPKRIVCLAEPDRETVESRQHYPG